MSTQYDVWDGRGVVGHKVTIPVPVSEDNASGVPVDKDLTGITITVEINKPDGSGGTASVAQSGGANEEHVALVTVTSGNLDSAGRWEFEIFLDDEPVRPRYAFYVDAAL